MKVAKLINLSFIVKAISDENSSEHELIEKGIDKLSRNLRNEFNENIESIVDDLECPYDETIDN